MLTNYIFERIERQTLVKIKANYSKKVNLPDTHKVVFPLLLFSVQFEIKPFALQGSTDRLGPKFSKNSRSWSDPVRGVKFSAFILVRIGP